MLNESDHLPSLAFKWEKMKFVMLNKIVVNVFLLSSLNSRTLNHTQMLSISIRLLVRYFSSPTMRTNSNKNNFGLLQKNVTITTTGQCGTFSPISIVFFFKVCCPPLSYNKIDTLGDIHGRGLWWGLFGAFGIKIFTHLVAGALGGVGTGLHWAVRVHEKGLRKTDKKPSLVYRTPYSLSSYIYLQW